MVLSHFSRLVHQAAMSAPVSRSQQLPTAPPKRLLIPSDHAHTHTFEMLYLYLLIKFAKAGLENYSSAGLILNLLFGSLLIQQPQDISALYYTGINK